MVLCKIFLADLLVCEIDSREDQQRQVEVSEDGVTCGYKLNDTDLGSSCACEQQYNYEKAVLKRSALIGLTIELGISCYCAEAESYSGGKNGDENCADIHELQAGESEC